MTVKITYLNKKGDSTIELSEEEAQELVDAQLGRYYVVDAETRQVIREIRIEDGQNLVLVPVARGG